MAVIMGLGPLFYILLGFRYTRNVVLHVEAFLDLLLRPLGVGPYRHFNPRASKSRIQDSNAGNECTRSLDDYHSYGPGSFYNCGIDYL